MFNFQSNNARTSLARKNILVSIISKGLSVLCSLLVVPMTINYVNPTQYGIWMTLSSIIAWIAFFDLGLANGLRNKFTEAKANDDMVLAKRYVSTTYFALGAIASLVLICSLIANRWIDWSSVLKVDSGLTEELRTVFAILATFFCLNLVCNIISMLFTADQLPGLAAIINAAGQLFSLVSIFLLTRTTEGSLVNLATYYAGIPCIALLLASLIAFSTKRYKAVRPQLKDVRMNLLKGILGLGVQFFIIYVCMILIMQMTNVVLSRELGPESVTQYNIAYKYFNVLYSVMLIIITPFWSASTDAYQRRDMDWLRKSVKSLERCWLLSILCSALMLAVSGLFYKIWLNDAVSIPFSLSVAEAIFFLSMILGNIYMYIINGIGTIRIQLITYCALAVISWPALNWSCRTFGVFGIVILPTIAYFAQALLGKIQLSKILSGTATGWWNK